MLGLNKLINTSYALDRKNSIYIQPTLFETLSTNYDLLKSKAKGKIFTLSRDRNLYGNTDIEDFEWDYLEGDGDFRSHEVKKLRDEADIIITIISSINNMGTLSNSIGFGLMRSQR